MNRPTGRHWRQGMIGGLLLALVLAAAPVRAEAPEFSHTATPASLADLRAIQDRVQDVVARALPATVGVMMGASQGSGVIISEDGYVLTAGHVIREAGRDATLILADGRRVRARTLGINRGIDSGLLKITEEGNWPFVEMGASAELAPGQWCVALGHPGGYRRDRPPVVRLGRVLTSSAGAILSDCTLVGGDSGGPLFDLDGRVIGIHSRIGSSTNQNIHVPVDTYTQTWERLVAGDTWGGAAVGPARGGPFLGISGQDHEQGVLIDSIVAGSPAENAGLRAGDIIVTLNRRQLSGMEELVRLIGGMRVGQRVVVGVQRDGEQIEVRTTLAARP